MGPERLDCPTQVTRNHRLWGDNLARLDQPCAAMLDFAHQGAKFAQWIVDCIKCRCEGSSGSGVGPLQSNAAGYATYFRLHALDQAGSFLFEVAEEGHALRGRLDLIVDRDPESLG